MSTILRPTPEPARFDDDPQPRAKRTLRRAPERIASVRTLASYSTPRGALGPIIALVGLGLLIQAWGYALGRGGHASLALPLFFIGLLAIFAPCAWGLLAPRTRRGERISIVIVLGLGLCLSNYLFNPLLFSGFDDLLHQASLGHLANNRSLFVANTELPVSPYYPVLELLTVAIRWLTGLPMVVCELTVVLLSRLVLVLVIYLLCERLTRSERAGGIGVLVYALSPQFYSFNSSYSYQTVALAFGAGAIYFLLAAVDRRKPKFNQKFILSLLCMVGAITAHHLIGVLTVGLVVIWAVVLTFQTRRDPGQKAQGRLVTRAALIGTVALIAWTAVSAHQVFSYLNPILVGAWDGVIGTLTRSNSNRALFHSSSGAVTPMWQQLILILSPIILLSLLVPAVRAVVFRKQLRGGLQRLIPVGIALGFLFVLGSRLSAGSADVGARASTFVFFGMALCLAAWFVRARIRIGLPVLVALATICFLGSMILGSGPSSTYTPGPYMPAADQQSVDAASITAATWASTHIPAGSSIAADRDNGALMAAIGHLAPVTALSGQVNVGPIYFDPVFGNYERTLIRQNHIQYLVVDDRLVQGPPANGAYFEPGETQGTDRLTVTELAKFDNIPGVNRVYDNGPIQIYDLSKLAGTPSAATMGGTNFGSSGRGVNLWMLIPFLVVASLWIRRAVGRRRPYGLESSVTWMLRAMCVAVGAALVFVPTGLPATPVALVVLAVLAVVGLKDRQWWSGVHRPVIRSRSQYVTDFRSMVTSTAASVGLWRSSWWARARDVSVRNRWSSTTRWLGRHHWAVLGTVCCTVAIAVSSVSAASDWKSPSALSITPRSGGSATVQVTLPATSGATTASVEALRSSKVVWSAPVGDGSTSATVPHWALSSSTQVALVVGGHVIRTVHG